MRGNKKFFNSKIISIMLIVLGLIALISGATIKNVYVKSEAYQVKKLLAAREENGQSDEDIDFLVFFLRDTNNDGYAEIMEEIDRSFETEDLWLQNTNSTQNNETMWFELNIKKPGTLKNGKLTIEDSNFEWKTNIIANNIYKDNYIGYNSEIEFHDLNTGTQVLTRGDVVSKIRNNIHDYNKESIVVLTGTFVDNAGNETEIRKESKLKINWYGESSSQILSINNGIRDIEPAIKEDCFQANFSFYLEQTNRHLLMQKQEVEVTIPSYNGYEPISVTTLSGTITQEYDEENKTIKILREATIDENGNITKSIEKKGYYNITVTYPKEAYTNSGSDYAYFYYTVKGKSYAFNSEKHESPLETQDIKSMSTTYRKEVIPQYNYVPDTWRFYTSIGSYSSRGGINSGYISKEKPYNLYVGNIYENDDEPDIYYVANDISVGQYEKIKNITVNLSVDKFNSSKTMIDYVTTTGIYFSNATNFLGNDGTIELYNTDTDELVETFTKETWEQYNKDNPYVTNLKNLQVKTSNPVKNTSMSIYQIKTLDDEAIFNGYTESEFEKLYNIYTCANASITLEENQSSNSGITKSEYNTASYRLPYSVVGFNLSPNEIPNQKPQILNLGIGTYCSGDFEKGWKNGKFLIELPNEIINAKINNLSISNSNVSIKSQVLYKENGKLFVRIDTENEQEEVYYINIELEVNANPLHGGTVNYVNLYAYNENWNIYDFYGRTSDNYDLDNDLSVFDYIGHSSCKLTTIAAQGLITEEYVTNYDDDENVTIAPNIAEIDRSDEARTAKINISIANNYPERISELLILGKIPYENNTFVLTGDDLGSEYSVNMTGPIEVPTELSSYTTVYYSEKEEPTKDLTNVENGWTTNVEDWTKIKSYLIDLGSYVLNNNGNKVFSYTVEVPARVGYNEVTYATHAAYFSINTDYGKYRTEIQSNKVGLQVVSKYNLELTKSKMKCDDIFVPGAIYSITTNMNGREISKVATTDTEGKMLIKGLYSLRDYTLSEVSSPADYVLNENKVVFNTEVQEEQIEIKSGSFKFTPEFTMTENGTYLVKANVEDEAKYKLKVKVQDETGNILKEEKFTIIGKGKENIVKTVDGELEIRDLYVGSEYQLKEIKADGYYIDEEPRIFKIVRDETTQKLKIVTDDEDLINSVIVEEIEGQSEVNVIIVNKKIPTYNMQVFKIEELKEENDDEEEEELKFLSGADFKVVKEDLNETELFTTNDEGVINLTDFYTFVEEKQEVVSGKYKVQEVKAPDGYSNNLEEIEFYVEENNGALEIHIENRDSLETLYKTEVEDNTVKIYIQDKPLFKLTKIDYDTGEVLANAKFVIYELDSNNKEIDFAKDVNGEYVGVKDDNGDYIVTTDENGTITLPLRAGKYVIKEVGYPEGYLEDNNYQVFKVRGAEDEEVEVEDEREIYDTFEVQNIEDLVKLSDLVSKNISFENTEIKLMRDLDFEDPNSYKDSEDKSFGDINGNGEVEELLTELTTGAGFMPIGCTGNYYYNANYFKGIFDGQDHEIKNLYINRSTYYKGLFGRLNNAVIKNLGITGSIRGSSTFVGSIAGDADYSSILNCYNEVAISISYYSTVETGGLVGDADYCKFINCYNKGSIYTYARYAYVGGIVGIQRYSEMRNCYNTASIQASCGGNTMYVGGLSSSCYLGYVSDCYNTGTVTGSGGSSYSYSGGIIGNLNNSRMENCYNVNNVSGQSRVNNKGTYSLANTSNSGVIINCYYLDSIEVTGGTAGTSGTAKNSAEMKSEEFVKTLGKENWSLDYEEMNNGYPILLKTTDFSSKLSNKTTQILNENNKEYENTLEIYTIEDLIDFANDVNSGIDYSNTEVILKNDLDFSDINSYENYEDTSYGDLNYDGNEDGIKEELTNEDGIGFTPIGSYSYQFKGKFNGNKKQIKNLYINQSDSVDCSYFGLFGYITNAEIVDLSVSGKINSINSYEIGGVVGYANNSIIKNCNNYCNIQRNCSSGPTGGVVGRAYQSLISDSKNEGYISGGEYIGGIVGQLECSPIDNCINKGIIEECSEENYNTAYIGGIVGYVYSTSSIACYITNCQNEADINELNQSSVIGGIAGYIYCSTSSSYKDNITISKCSNKGTLKSGIVGGIVGGSDGNDYYTYSNISYDINNCINTGTIIGNRDSYDTYVGGIIGKGYSQEMKIRNCTNKGNILSEADDTNYSTDYYDSIGGIAGYYCGSINNCNNEGRIESDIQNIGGICGRLNSRSQQKITNCYNKGNIIVKTIEDVYYSSSGGSDSGFKVGGIIGYFYNQNNNSSYYYLNDNVSLYSCEISNCYNLGNISTNIDPDNTDTVVLGGIIGDANSYGSYYVYREKAEDEREYEDDYYEFVSKSYNAKISQCYNNGTITAFDVPNVIASGIIGVSQNTDINHCYNTGVIHIETTEDTCSSYATYMNPCSGGIAGFFSNGNINCCYNTGDITSINNDEDSYNSCAAGGIVGDAEGAIISNTYNNGNITNKTAAIDYCCAVTGGIAGGIDLVYSGDSNSYYELSYIYNSYNIGDLISEGREIASSGMPAIGGITGYAFKLKDVVNSYYIKNDKFNNYGTPMADVDMITPEFYDTLNVDGVWKYNKNDFPTLLDMDIFIAGEVNEIAELNIENTIKKYKITTEVENSVGGTITAQDEEYSEIVWYGKSSTRAIEIKPDNGYSITKITINGKDYAFEANEQGKYEFPVGFFTDMFEDKHIVVTFSADDNILTINKVDENNENKTLEGAKFYITSDTRDEVTDEIGEVIPSGDAKYIINKDKPVDFDRTLTNNGVEYISDIIDTPRNELLGNMVNKQNGFTESDGKYISTNTSSGSTGLSYFEIDLTEQTGNYAVMIDAETYSNYRCYGYAAIRTTNTVTPTYSTTTGRFMNIQGTWPSKKYTSMVLEGGNKYYLYIGFYCGTNNTNYKCTINSIDIYEVLDTSVFGFEENNGEYSPNNIGINTLLQPTYANTYMKIDLRNKPTSSRYYVQMNVESSGCSSGDYIYATVNQSTSMQTYGNFVEYFGNSSSKKYTSSILNGGYIYYLHFGFENTNSDDKTVIMKDINVYEADAFYYCMEQVNGKYISNNQNQDDSIAKSYIPIDLRNATGNYDLTINAEISSQRYNDYGYAIVREHTYSPSYYEEYGRVLYITGNEEAQDYTTTLTGGTMYYLHIGYYKDSSTSSGDDTFTINSVKLSLNRDNYYYEEYTTNELGVIKAIVPGDANLNIKELVAPNGYTLSNTVTTYQMRPGETNEVTIGNKEQTKLTVHHYIKGTTNKITEDDIYKGDVGESYEVTPRLDVDKFNLAKDAEGKYIIPEDAKGTYGENDFEIAYYYEAEPIKLTVHHYFDGTEDKYQEDEIIENPAEYVVLENGLYTVSTDTKYEYKLDNSIVYNNLPEEMELVDIRSNIKDEISVGDTLEYSENSEVSFYYKAKKFGYEIHYFYDGVEDISLKETGTEEYGRTVNYTNKLKDGYNFDRVEGVPLVISSNVQENIINVYYEQPNTLKVLKTDSEGNTLKGAKFEITSVDSSMNVINELIPTDEVEKEECSDLIYADMGDSSFYDYYSGDFYESYSFEEEDGKYVSYCDNGYNTNNIVCLGYMSVDLEDKLEKYSFTVNAEISSEENGDYGYIIVNESTSNDDYHIDIKNLPSTAKIVAKISGEVSAKDYVAELQGGKYYYIYFVYEKNYSVNEGEDKFTINNVKLEQIRTYEFEEQNGTYTSTNANVNDSKSYNYIPVDLTEYAGTYKVNVNAEIDATADDFGAVAITESTEIPTDFETNYIYLTGEDTKEDTKVLEGGKKYFIHMIYDNNSSDATNSDTFKINSIKVELDKTTITTDENGIAVLLMNANGSFEIKETQSPKNYKLDETPTQFEMLATENRKELVITNEKMNLTSFNMKNEWIVSNPEEYKTTFALYKAVGGQTTKVVDDNTDIEIEIILDDVNGENTIKLDGTTGEISAVIVGNGTIRFNNLPKTENDEEITYSIVEEKVEKTNNSGSTWTEVPTSEVKVKHDYTNPDFDDVITNSLASRFGIEITQVENQENNPLKDVEYTISIKDQDGNELVDQTKTYKTNEDGQLEILDLLISNPDKKYTVTISTEDVPEGYEDIGPITFEVQARENSDGTYELTPSSQEIENNDIEVTEDRIKLNLVTGYKSDLTYTVYYLDKETKDELVEAKVATNVTYNEVINADDEIIDIPGYEYTNSLQGSITISEDNSRNILSMYYVPVLHITTKVNEHDEVYRTSTNKTGILGGTISGQNDDVYESLLRGEDATKDIVITPNEGYEIARVTITTEKGNENLNIESYLNEDGKSITLNAEDTKFQKIRSDINVEAEFRKKSSITVKYLDKDTKEVLSAEVELPGYESKAFEAPVALVNDYRLAKMVLDNSVETSVTYVDIINGEEVYTNFDTNNSTMSADSATVIFWYEPIPEGTVLVRHIEIDEKDKNGNYNLNSGSEITIEEIATLEEYRGQVGTTKDTSRNVFTDSQTGRTYIAVDGPESNNVNIEVMDKDTNNYTALIEERDLNGDGLVDTKEIRYYYERAYEITTRDASKDDSVGAFGLDDNDDLEKYGTISGEDENPYEVVFRNGSNEKAIEITPINENYYVKLVSVNGESINITDMRDESGKVTIPAGYFSDVVEDKKIAVVFGKDPVRVIVKFLEDETNEEVDTRRILVGEIGEEYDATPKDIDGYELVETRIPSNAKGTMTKDDIEVIFYYKKIEIKPEEPENPEIPEKPEEPETEPTQKDEKNDVIYENGGDSNNEETPSIEQSDDGKEPTVTIVYENENSNSPLTRKGRKALNPNTGDNIIRSILMFITSIVISFMFRHKKDNK